MRIDLDFKYKELIDILKNEAPFTPDIAVVLGSGLGEFADSVNVIKSIKSSDLPGYLQSAVAGHKNTIHFAEYKEKKLLLFQGRIHFYEGFKIYECILPIFIAKKLNVKNLLLTNAAGGINPNFIPGDLMLIKSVNSLSIKKQITESLGLASLDNKNAFLNFPSNELNEKIVSASLNENVNLKEGTYWITTGPSYETKAEIQMMLKFGVDAVGMSTVHEAIYGAINGMNVSGISCITNLAAGLGNAKLDHKEVIETADMVKEKFERLVKNFISLV